MWRARLTAVLLASTALAGLGAAPAAAQSLPTGYSTAAGAVSFQKSSGTLTINQTSQSAIVNYNSFSIGQRNIVNIRQPNRSSAILNRVTGSTPSTIAGQLNANGQVYLINPNGIAITKTGIVKVGGGFVASSLAMSNYEWKHGRKHFRGHRSSAAVSNAGTITIGRGGYAALIGGEVKNSGLISVPMGKVGLGSGEAATLDVSGDGFLEVAVPTSVNGKAALIQDSGTIKAVGGTVVLTAATARAAARNAVNISGGIDAHSISGHNGSILIGGGAGGSVKISGALNVSGGARTAGGTVRVTGRKVKVSGTINASGRSGGAVRLAASHGATITGTIKAIGRHGAGGAITLTGLRIALKGATVNASGATGGGAVLIGGDQHGAGPLPNADTVTIDANSVITADATGAGNGGNVVIWSDETTSFAGQISAQGGPDGGDGGNAEVSSHGVLAYTGTTILTAPDGATGTLLLDPYDVVISTGTDSGYTGTTTSGTTTDTPSGASVINNATLDAQLVTANVTITTGAVGSAGTDAGNITVAAPITWSTGSLLTLTAANAIAINANIAITGAGQLALNTATTTIGSTTQPLLSFGNGASVSYAVGSGSGISGQALTINSQVYALEYSLGALATAVGTHTFGFYALAATVDGSNSGNGYTDSPIAELDGTLEGLGNTITNFTAAGTARGLIAGNFGTVRDIALIGGSVGVLGGASEIGDLAGTSEGTIVNARATGAVSGSDYVGGLVGFNTGTIQTSIATGAVSGTDGVGGLAGVNGNGGGGLVQASYAAGAVSGSTGNVGGLVGENDAMVQTSYATGAVSAPSQAGGLVGSNDPGGTVQTSYATGAVSASYYLGGLVGYNSGTVQTSYFDTQTTGLGAGLGAGSGSATGLTTAQLQGAAPLPAGVTFSLGAAFSGGAAGGQAGLYPYLTAFNPSTPQAISGIAYADRGVTPLASNASGPQYVFADAGGAQTSATTGANGYYYILEPAGTLAPAGAATLAYTAATNTAAGTITGASLISATGTTQHLDIWGNTLIAPTTVTSLTGATIAGLTTGSGLYASNGNATLATTAEGANTTTGLGALAYAGYIATGSAGFTVDAAVASGAASGGLYVQTTQGPITVAAAQTLTTSTDLSLYSEGALAIDAPITAEGPVQVNLAYNTASTTNLSFAQGASLTYTDSSGGSLAGTSGAGGSLTINGASYTLLYSMNDLAAISDGNDALATNVVSSGTYQDAVIPTFAGTLEGLGNTITGLTINSLGFNNVGFVGNLSPGGVVRDLGLVGGSVAGLIEVGGVVGQNNGTISNVYDTGSVSGSSAVGGLVGDNEDSISQSFATGSVSAPGGSQVGGLVGFNDGSISQSFATGSVSVPRGSEVGGLVGFNEGSISQAYAAGAVSGSSAVGGLVGENVSTISQGYFDTDTTGLNNGIGVDYGPSVTGLTTRQLQGLDPLSGSGGTAVYFSVLSNLGDGATSAFSGGTAGLYPYLTNFFPNGVQAVAGTAQTTGGAQLAGAQVGIYSGRTLLSGGDVSSGANGYFYEFLPSGALAASGVKIGATVTPSGGAAVTGLAYADGLTGNIFALGTITSGLDRQNTAEITYSALQIDLGATFGSTTLSALNTTLASTPISITASGAGFTLDETASAGAAFTLATTGANAPLMLTEDLDASGQTVTLNAASLISQTGGTITAGTLAGSSKGGASFTQTNSVASLGSFTDSANGNVSLTDRVATLGLSGTIGIGTGTLTLNNDGAISQTGGMITAGTLTGASNGGASFAQANSIPSLGAFTDTGNGNLSLTDAVTSLGITGAVAIGAGTLSLTNTTGGISESGSITAGALTGLSKGAATFNQSLNDIAALGAFDTTNNGTVLAGYNLSVINSYAGQMDLTGAITLGTVGALTLTDTGGGIDQTGGSITAATLTGSSNGAAAFVQTTNNIEALGAFDTTSAGAAPAGYNLSVTNARAGQMSLTGAITLGAGGTLTLTDTGGDIDQTGGSITAAALTGVSKGSASFTQTTNTIAALGAFDTTDGGVLATGGVLSMTTSYAGQLSLTGNIKTGTNNDLTLTDTGGSIDQTGGTIQTPYLSGQSKGGASFTQSNDVLTLSSFTDTANGNLSLTDAVTTIGVNGAIAIGSGTLSFTNTVGGLNESGGSITAGMLTGSTKGVTSFGQSTNTIAALGAFDTTSAGAVPTGYGLSLVNSYVGQMGLTGVVKLGTSGLLTLTDTGGSIDQTGGSITASKLTGASLGGASFTQANVIPTLGAFTDADNGNVSLTDGVATLYVSGAVAIGVGTLSLTNTAGGIDQNSGSITAGALTGAANGTATFTLSSNNIAALGVFDTTNAGAVPAGYNLSVTNAYSGQMDLTGALTLGTSGVLTLTDAGGSIDQTGGSITASKLTGASLGGASFTQANVIPTLGAFTDTGNGNVSLTDGVATLYVSGAVAIGAGTLSLTNTAGGIDQDSGSITAGVLTGSSYGSATFAQSSNSIAALGAFDTTDGGVLATGGVLSMTTSYAGQLSLAGNIKTGTNNELLLTDTGGSINQTGGSIQAPLLTGQSKGGASFTQSNDILTLGGFTDTANGNLSLTDAVATIGVNGAIAIGSGTLSFTNTVGGLNEDGGSITAGTLTGAVKGLATFTQSSNAIAALGAFDTTGGGALPSGAGLSVTNSYSGQMGLTGAVTLGTGGLLTLTDTGGSIDQTGGSITASKLTGASNGAASFGQSSNNFEVLGAFDTTSAGAIPAGYDLSVTDAYSGVLGLTGAITLGTSGALTLTNTGGGISQTSGSITAGALTGSSNGMATFGQSSNTIAALGAFDTTSAGATPAGYDLSVITSYGGQMGLTGAITLGTAGVLTLTDTGGGIDQTGGSITAAALAGVSKGSASFTQTANTIAALGAFDTTDGGVLATGGILSMTTSYAGQLSLTGNIKTGTNNGLTLTDTGGNIDQTGGTIRAPLLTGQSKGGASFTQSNDILTLGSFTDTANGNLSLTDAVATIGVNGAIAIGSGTLSFTNTVGGLDEGGGSITAGTLTGAVNGPAGFTQSTNAIAALGAFDTTDNGTVPAGYNLSVTTSYAGQMSLTGAVKLGTSGVLTLTDTGGSIDQTGGSIAAATLTGSSNGAATFGQSSNTIAALGAFDTTSAGAAPAGYDLSVTDAYSGVLGLTGAITLGTSGTLALTNTGGGVRQTSGSITAAALTGSSNGTATFGQSSNTIAALGAFDTTSAGATPAGYDLSVATSYGGQMGLTGAVALGTGGVLTLTDTGGSIDQTGGSIATSELTGASNGAASFGQSNAIATLGSFTTGGNAFTLVDTGNLTVNGTLSTSAGVTNASAGAIMVTSSGALTVDAPLTAVGDGTGSGGAVTLSGTTISVGAITATSASGTDGAVALTDTTSLALGGAISGASLTTGAGTATFNPGSSVTTAGAAGQTYNGPVTLGGNVMLTANGSGAIDFTSSINGGYALTLSTTGRQTFATAVGNAATLTSLATGSGAAGLDGNVTTTGAQTYAGPVTLAANATLTSIGSGALTFGSTVNGGFGLTTTTGGVTTFSGAVGGMTPLASLVTGGAGTTALNGGSVSTTGAQTYNDTVALGATTTLTSTGSGAIDFGGTVNGAFGLTVNTAGATTFGGVVGGTTALVSMTTDSPGTAVLDSAITTTGAQTYNDAVTLGGTATLTSTSSGAIDFASAVDGGQSLTINDAGGATTFSGAVGSSAELVNLTLAGATLNLGAVSATGTLSINDTGAITPSGAVTVGTFVLSGGSWSQNSATLPSFTANNFEINGGTFLRVLGGDGSDSPYLITDIYGLQGMEGFLSSNFQLANNVNASGTSNWNGGAGFSPIGNVNSAYFGVFNGAGFTISNLFIKRLSNTFIGLFGESQGTLENVTLAAANITGITYVVGQTDNVGYVGGLVGENEGENANYTEATVSNSSVSGTVTGGTYDIVGGLVGGNFAAITTSSSSANVTGGSSATAAGGLVGYNYESGYYQPTISQSYSTGTVTGGGSGPLSILGNGIGGLVGFNYGGIITDSYSTATVTGSSYAYVGGLVAENDYGNISTSYAAGAVSGSANTTKGGFVGKNAGTNAIANDYVVGSAVGSGSSSGITVDNAMTLMSALPSGFNTGANGGCTSCWGIVPGVTNPFLLSQPNVISGIVYSTGTPVVGATVSDSLNGVAGSYTVTTGANGNYAFLLGSIPTGANLLTYTSTGAAYLQGASGNVSGLTINNTYLSETTPSTSASGLASGLAAAIGGNTALQMQVNNLSNLSIDATGASFVIDQALNVGAGSGTFLLNTAGAVTQSAPIMAGSLALGGSGASYTLTNTMNSVGALAANASGAAVSLYDTSSLSIGAVQGTNGVAASALYLSFAGGQGVSQSQAVKVSALSLSGSGAGADTLTNSSNSVGTFAASVGGGTISLTNTSSLSFGTVNAISGVTAAALTLSDSGSVTQSQPVAVTGLTLAGGGSYTLTNGANSIGTLAATVSSLNLSDTVSLAIDAVSTATGAVTLTDSAPLAIDASLSANGPITLTNDSLTVAAAISAPGQTVTIQPFTAGTTLGLGAGAGMVSLTQAELADITASTLVFGNTISGGAITVGGAVLLPSTVTNLTLASAAAAGITVLNGASLNDAKAGGAITLQANSVALNGAIGETGAGGIVTLLPATAGTSMGLGAGAGALSLSAASLSNITAATFNYGNTSQTGAITVDGAVAVPMGITNFNLATGAGGGITVGTTMETPLAALSDPDANGTITLQANTVVLNGTVGETGSNGVVTILPTSTGTSMGLGTGSGALSLSQASLSNIMASTFNYGGASQTGPITVGGAVTTPAGISNLDLITTGAISVASMNSLANNNANGGIALLTNANPALTGTLSVNSTSGTITIAPIKASTTIGLGTASETIKLTQAELSDISASNLDIGSASTSGAITVTNATGSSVPLTSVTNLTLETTGVISLSSSATSLVDSNANGSITLLTNANPTLKGTLSANSTSGTVTIAPIKASTTIGLGTASETIKLTQAELSDISAFNLDIGSASTSGAITVTNATGSSVPLPSSVTNLTLETTGIISLSSAATSLVDGAANGSIAFLTNVSPTLTGTVKETGLNGLVSIAPIAPSTTILLGSSGAGAIVLASLANITATTLDVGNPGMTGAINVDASGISAPTTVINLSLVSGGTVAVNGALADSNANGALTLQGSGLTLGAAVSANSSSGTVVLNTTGTAAQSTGIITAADLLLLGSGGGYTLTGANAVGTLAANTGGVDFNDGGSFTTGAVNGAAGVTGSGPITLTSGGALTIASGDAVVSTGSGNDVVLAAIGDFINNAGSNAVSVAGSGSWLIYSSAPGTDTFDSLNSNNTAIWDATIAILPPASVMASGDRYIFAYQPTLTFTSTGILTKTYGADKTAAVAASSYSVSGLQPGVAGVFLGDTNATAFSGTLTLTSSGAGTSADASATPYNITLNVSGLTSSTGYAVATVNDGTLTVTPATLTITASDQSKPYGTTLNLGATAFTETGLVTTNGDTISGVTLASAGAASSATVAGGPYAISASAAQGSGLSNYTIGYAAGGLTVTPATLTITASDQSKLYGTTLNLGATAFTEMGLVTANGDTISGVTLASAGSVSTATVNGGTPYAINASAAQGSGLSNYTIGYVAGGLTVTPATLTITASNQIKTYGQTAALGTTAFTEMGLVTANGDTISGVTLASASTATVNGGTPYAINASAAQGSGLSNYTIGYVAGALTVTPATLTITASDQSKTYGTTPNLGATAFTETGLVTANGDTISGVTLASAGAASSATVAGGPYAISASAAQGSGLSNYTIGYAAGGLTVTPATLTITASNQSKPYGTTLNLGTTAFTEMGLVTANGDTISGVTLASAGSVSTATVNGGTPYAINPSAAQGSGLSNYTIGYVAGALAVTPATLTITASDQMKTYGQTAALGTTALTETGLVIANGDTISGVTLASAGAASSATVAGAPYAINPSAAQGSGLSNYTIGYVAGGLTVTPATLTITVSNQIKTYGQTAALGATAFTETGLVTANGDTISGVTLASAGAASSATVAGGPYAISASAAQGSGLSNYTIGYAAGGLTVTPATLTITASDQMKTYGQTASLGTTAFTETGLVIANGDTISGVTLASAGSVSTATVNGGTPYAINPSAAQGSGLSNYTIGYAAGGLTVTPATLTITASNQIKTYGQTAALGATAFTETGLVIANGDTISGVTLASAGAASSATVAGAPYAINPSAAQGSGLSNYTIGYAAGGLTVNPAPITVTALGGASVYGSLPANPGLSAMGLQNGQTVSVLTGLSNSFGINGQTSVGAYTVSVAGRLSNANYVVNAAQSGAFDITPRPVTIIANNEARIDGFANPPLAYRIGGLGLVNGDGLTGALATAATIASPIGRYPITQGTLAASGNYQVTYEPGALTIEPSLAAPASELASTAEDILASVFGLPSDALPWVFLPTTGDASSAAQIVLSLDDPRFDEIVVCTGGGMSGSCGVVTLGAQKAGALESPHP